MDKLSKRDNDFFYLTFRGLIQYVNHRFHLDDKANLQLDEKIDPATCKKAANMVWDKTSLIDDYIEYAKIKDTEQLELLRSWKNCVKDKFFIERHLKNGSIFIDHDSKVYQVIGLTDPLEVTFYYNYKPTILNTTLLPFKDVIITDGLYEVFPIMFGSHIKSHLKEIYSEAKRNKEIITQLIPVKEQSDTERPSKKARKSESTVNKETVYQLTVYPQGLFRTVSRVIEIAGNYTLADLCSTILRAFEFDDDHVYEFCMDNDLHGYKKYQSYPEGKDDLSVDINLEELNLYPKQKFLLHYDFGDNWVFAIRVDKITGSQKHSRPEVISSKGHIEQYEY